MQIDQGYIDFLNQGRNQYKGMKLMSKEERQKEWHPENPEKKQKPRNKKNPETSI